MSDCSITNSSATKLSKLSLSVKDDNYKDTALLSDGEIL